MLCSSILEQIKENDVENKIHKFKLTYSIKKDQQLNAWYGCTFDNIFKQVGFNATFKKIYHWYCSFTHNVSMKYYDGNKYSDKPSPEDIIETLFVLNTLQSLFLVEFYPIRKLNACILEELYLKPFTEIGDKYEIGI